MPKKTKILTPLTIVRGGLDFTYQYYQIQAKDADENFYIISLGCQLLDQKMLEQILPRMILIPAPSEEEMKSLIH
jgi:hypothetical protein